MKTNGWVASSQRLYRWLLQLYPQTYRANYEEEMFHLFTDQCRDVSKQQGSSGRLLFWLRTLADFGATVLREHLSDPHARLGLLEAAPNAPLPWKGVLLVLIPGLIFFISQVEQLTSTGDWFFMVFYRGAYFLILPVLFIWVLTRRFPVWGLIPLGLLYETLWDYGQRFDPGSIRILSQWFANGEFTLFNTSISIYYAKYWLAISICLILLGVLLWHNVRRGQISRGAWRWLGLYGLLVALRIGWEVYQFYRMQGYTWPPELMEYLFQIPMWYLFESLPFLVLVFIGLLFARKYAGFTFLLLLGYLLPTLVFGRYDPSQHVVPFYLVSTAILTYRFVVALVAPVWLVRAASVPGRQRAAAIPVAIAIACHISLNIIVSLTWARQYGLSLSLLELVSYAGGQLIIAAGLALAVVLYLPREKDQAVLSPPELVVATE